MGVIRRGILGGFSNKVGNIVGSTWKGIAIVKSLPLSVANPRTAGQVLQRKKFKTLTTIASLLLSGIVKPLWDRFASNMSGYNSFISANMNAFDSSGSINTEKFVFSRGRMTAPSISSASLSGNQLTVTIGNPANDRFGLPTDRIYVGGLGLDYGIGAFGIITSVTRSSSSTAQVVVTVPAAVIQANLLDVYAGYVRSDGSEVSNSGWSQL